MIRKSPKRLFNKSRGNQEDKSKKIKKKFFNQTAILAISK
jgi:hypothetical protein